MSCDHTNNWIRNPAYVLLFIVYSNLIWGQSIVSGKLVDTLNQAISDVNIIAKSKDSSQFLGFAFSVEDGTYSVSYSSDDDSVLLVFSHLAFDDKYVHVANQQKNLDITLFKRQNELPEIVVDRPVVMRRGDTLFFDADHYTRDSDKNIEDILARLPGIEVEANGEILYKGLPISGLYIEGLNLFEGRYNVITKQLNHKVIEDIEVIEHHQPKKVLQGLIKPQEAAINLKLKSGIALTGKAQAGIGFSPLLYQIDSDVFGFAKKNQFHVTVGSNNFGYLKQTNYVDLISIKDAVSNQIISTTRVIPPLQLRLEQYADNREHIAGLNYLKKIGENTQIKWYGKISVDKRVTSGQDSLMFGDQENQLIQDFGIQNTDRQTDMDQKIVYELNKSKLYLRADSDLNMNWSSTVGDNTFSGLATTEDLDRMDISSKSNLELTIRNGERARSIYANFKYDKLSDELTLRPTEFFVPEPQVAQRVDIAQIYDLRRFEWHTYTSFVSRKKSINRIVDVGLKMRNKSISSHMQDLSATPNEIFQDSRFRNNSQLELWSPYVQLSLSGDRSNSSWQLNIPMRWLNLKVEDKQYHETIRTNELLYQIDAEYLLSLKKNYSLQFDYHFQSEIDDRYFEFYNGYIIRSNGNVSRGNLKVNKFDKHEFSLALNRQLIYQNLFYSVALSHSITNNTLLQNLELSDFGNSRELLDSRNTRRQYGLDLRVHASLNPSLDMKLKFNYSLSRFPYLLEDELVNTNNHRLETKSEFSYSFPRGILSFKPTWIRYNSQTLDQPFNSLVLRTVLYIKDDSYGSLRLSYDPYLIIHSGSRNWNQLIGLEYRKDLMFKAKHKAELILRLNNLANEKTFNTFEQNFYYSKFSSIDLRPRQLRLSLKVQI